jgi:hypothetical protein
MDANRDAALELRRIARDAALSGDLSKAVRLLERSVRLYQVGLESREPTVKSSCDCLQEPGADQELREIRMRYARERDIQNENLPHDVDNLSFLPQSIRNILARTFGPRRMQSIFWLFSLIGVFLLIRLLLGSPLSYFGRLPADIRLKGPNWQFYAPLGTCVLLSFFFSTVSRILGPILARPARYSQPRRESVPSATGGVQFHGSIVVCAVQ